MKILVERIDNSVYFTHLDPLNQYRDREYISNYIVIKHELL